MFSAMFTHLLGSFPASKLKILDRPNTVQGALERVLELEIEREIRPCNILILAGNLLRDAAVPRLLIPSSREIARRRRWRASSSVMAPGLQGKALFPRLWAAPAPGCHLPVP